MKFPAFFIFTLLVASQTTVVFSTDEGEDQPTENVPNEPKTTTESKPTHQKDKIMKPHIPNLKGYKPKPKPATTERIDTLDIIHWTTFYPEFIETTTAVPVQQKEVEQLKTVVQQVEGKLKQLQQQIEDTNSKPMFFAKKRVASPPKPGTPQLLIAILGAVATYDEVAVNIGNGLNARTGIFKAPIEGVYYFHASSIIQSGAKAELMHNGKPFITKIVPKGKDSVTWIPNDLQATLTLKKGDTVSIYFSNKGGPLSDHGVTFTGFLLRQASLPGPILPPVIVPKVSFKPIVPIPFKPIAPIKPKPIFPIATKPILADPIAPIDAVEPIVPDNQ